MEIQSFPCKSEARQAGMALYFAGRIVCGAGFVDSGGSPAVDELESVAAIADKVGYRESAVYLREGRNGIVVCARNQAAGRCLGYCGISG